MKETVSLCLFCREENASLIKITLNSMLKSLPSPWSEVIVIDLFFQRKEDKGLPPARYLSLKAPDTDPVAFAARHSKSTWLLLLEAGEGIRVEGRFDRQQPSCFAYYIPVSAEEEEGWEPGFAPRLLHRDGYLNRGDDPLEAAFLCRPFAISRNYHYTSFRLPPNLPALSEREPGYHYLLGEKARRKGNYKKAAEIFSRAYLAAVDPRLKRFFAIKKMSCLCRIEPGEEVLQQLARAEKRFSCPVEFLYLKGNTLTTLRRYREAYPCYAQAAASLRSVSEPQPWGPENFVITTAKAWVLAALQQRDRSLEACAHALTCCPGYLPALRLLAKVAFQHCPGPEGARLIYRHASPLQQSRYAAIARIFLENRRLTEALTWIKSGLKGAPENQELLYLQAYWYLKKGEANKCLAILRKIPEDSSYFREAFSMQCLCLWHLGDYRGALDLIDSGAGEPELKEEGEFFRCLHYHIQHRAKNPALQPFLPPLRKHDPLYLKLLDLSLNFSNREIFHILIDLANLRGQGKLNLKLAKLLAVNKERALAVSFFNKALEKEIYDSESFLFMGTIAMDEALFYEARELFSLALQKFPQDINIYLAFTRALLKEAALTVKEGLESNPDSILEKVMAEIQEALRGLDCLELDI